MTFLLKHIHDPKQTIIGNFMPEKSIVQISKFTLHIYTYDMHLIQEKCFGIEIIQISKFFFGDRDYILVLMENGRFVTVKYESGFKTVSLKWFKEGHFFRINCNGKNKIVKNDFIKEQKGFLKINEHEFAIFNIFERIQSKVYKFIDISPDLRNVIDALVLDFYPKFTVCMLYETIVTKYTKDSFFKILWWSETIIEDLEIKGVPIKLIKLDKIVVVVVEGALIFIKNNNCYRFEVETENAEFVVIVNELYKFKDENYVLFKIKQDLFRVYNCNEVKSNQVLEYNNYNRCNLEKNSKHSNSFTHKAIKFNSDIFYFDSLLFYNNNLFEYDENIFKQIGIKSIDHNDLILLPICNFSYNRIYSSQNAICFSSSTDSIIMTEKNSIKIEEPAFNFSEQDHFFLIGLNNQIFIYDQNLKVVKSRKVKFSKIVFKNMLIFLFDNSKIMVYNMNLLKINCFEGDNFFVGDYFGLLNGYKISIYDIKTIKMNDSSKNKKSKNTVKKKKGLKNEDKILEFCIFCEKPCNINGKEKDINIDHIIDKDTEYDITEFKKEEYIKDQKEDSKIIESEKIAKFFEILKNEDSDKDEYLNDAGLNINNETIDVKNLEDEVFEAFSADELKNMLENKTQDDVCIGKNEILNGNILQNDLIQKFSIKYDESTEIIGNKINEINYCMCENNDCSDAIQLDSIYDVFAVKISNFVTFYKIMENKVVKLFNNVYKVESLFVDDRNIFITGEISFCYNDKIKLSSKSEFVNENFCIKNEKLYEIKNKFDFKSRFILKNFLEGIFSLVYIKTKPAIFKKEVIDPNEEEQIVLDDRIGADTLRFSISLSNHVESENLEYKNYKMKNIEFEDTIDLLENEFVESFNIFPLKEVSSQTVCDFLVVGTAFVKGEDHQFRGRLLVFELIDVVPERDKIIGRRHKLLSFENCKGPVLDCCLLRGNIAACVGTRVLVYEIDRNEGLNAIAFHDMQILSVKIEVIKNYFYVADINNGLYFFYFQTRPFRIHFLAQTSKMCIENMGIVLMKNQVFLVCVGETVKVLTFDGTMTMFVQRLEFKAESFTLKNIDFTNLESLYDKMCYKDYFGTDKNELKSNVRYFSVLNEFFQLSLEHQNRLILKLDMKKEEVLDILHQFLLE